MSIRVKNLCANINKEPKPKPVKTSKKCGKKWMSLNISAMESDF